MQPSFPHAKGSKNDAQGSVIAIKGSLRDSADAWVERVANEKEAVKCVSMDAPAVSNRGPNIPDSQVRNIFPGNAPNNGLQPEAVASLTIAPPATDLSDDVDVEEDERDINILLTSLK